MRITKSWLRDVKRKLVESQAKLCGLLYADPSGSELWVEHQRRFPHYVGDKPGNSFELLRQLLYDDLERAIPMFVCQ